MLAAVPLCHSLPALAQSPGGALSERPIKLIAPFAAGSGADSYGRVYGGLLAKELGQPVIVENRPGGSGAVAIQAVRQLPADGHAILIGTNSPMVVNKITVKDLSYDPFKDLRPLYGIARGPAAFAVRADSTAKSMRELVDLAKAEKRPLRLGTYSSGYELIATWLSTAARVEIIKVPYKGAGLVMTDLIGGQIDAAVVDFGGTHELVRAKRIRVLATTDEKRAPKFSDIGLMRETYPGFETWVWTGLFLRSETPDPIVARLAAAMRQVMTSEPAKAFQADEASEPMLMGPAELGEFHRREYERFSKVAEAAGLKPQ
jgi:tripartite-type tricarboxylate transporter receptor subunit TctC